MSEPICYFCSAVPNGYRLIYNGAVYVFNMVGQFLRTEALNPINRIGAVQVNVLSLVRSTDKTFEVGVSVNNQFRVYEIQDYPLEDYLFYVQGLGGMVAILTRPLRAGALTISQNIFVYPNENNILGILNRINNSKGINWRVVK